jgi:amino acid adenylation domain-containing protein
MSTPPDDTRLLASRLQALSPARRAAVERLLRERRNAWRVTTGPEPADLAPASFGQQRLWFMAQLDPASPVYNTISRITLAAPIDLGALQGAVDALVARHESLRTLFEVVDGEPFQRVNASASVVVEAGVPATEFAHRPFDLQRGPLVRVCAAVDTGQVVVCMHHIVTDGWSMGIFLRELSVLYKGRLRNVPVKLPPLPIRYRDYAAWQRAELSGPLLSELLTFWRAELADLPMLDLVTDRPRPAMPSFRGGTIPLRISPDIVASLRALVRRQNATLFMGVLAAFSALLGRYSGQDEVVIGCPVAGRTRVETEAVIGFFVNTIILRCDLSGNPGFRQLLARIRDRAMRAYAHQDLPFDRLVEDLHPERDLSHNPLHQVVLHVVDLLSSDKTAGEAAGDAQIGTGTSPFDLVVHLRGAAELKGDIEYSSELFDRSSVERIAEHLVILLQALVSNPDAPLSQICMLTSYEERRLEEFNATAAPVPSQGVVELIDAQAIRAPDAIAVGTMTYRSLVYAANGVAHHLLSQGAGPDRLVAVSLPPGPDLVVALLGILKAGAAYLPLDPDDCSERRRQILANARPLLVLDDPRQFSFSCTDSPQVLPGRNNLAYVIYTSGSTGTPKGVLVEHASLSNLIAWHVRQYQITSKDRATLFANPAFDASVWELWPYLTAGASLHVPPPTARTPSGILVWFAEERITLAFLATPLAEAVLAEPIPPNLRLKFLLTGGDCLHRSPERGLPFALVNHYGPTEATVVATACPVPPATTGSRPPIGRPIDNVQVLVADRYGQPLPVGVPGELWIGGAGLARGYLGLPGLTSERFVQYGDKRMYRTGDRVRWDSDGALAFLGRLDQQVKLRGFRIEPGEIESHLQAHPQVRAAAVAVHGNLLVAYVVLSSPLARSDSLSTYLRPRLPSYMVPAKFQILETLPMTANGKIDRRALLSPIYDGSDYVAPRIPVEHAIAGIWAGLLGRERVGVHDDFFALGGHSLLAMQAISRIRSLLGVELSVGAVFGAPTVASLAAAVGNLPAASAASTQVIARLPRDRYRAEIGPDGMPILDPTLRQLLHLDD